MNYSFKNKNINYSLMTIDSFAAELAASFSRSPKAGQPTFLADFAISDLLPSDWHDAIYNSNQDALLKASPWFGVKELGEVGFNSVNRQLIFDYYGGGSMKLLDISTDDLFVDKLASDIRATIEELVEDIGGLDCLLLVQWTQDECLKKDEEEAVKPIEDAAVTNFAEMLCDYVSGLDEGEGIGREDIIDHLYEYINWDKRFTREYEEGKKNFKPF